MDYQRYQPGQPIEPGFYFTAQFSDTGICEDAVRVVQVLHLYGPDRGLFVDDPADYRYQPPWAAFTSPVYGPIPTPADLQNPLYPR